MPSPILVPHWSPSFPLLRELRGAYLLSSGKMRPPKSSPCWIYCICQVWTPAAVSSHLQENPLALTRCLFSFWYWKGVKKFQFCWFCEWCWCWCWCTTWRQRCFFKETFKGSCWIRHFYQYLAAVKNNLMMTSTQVVSIIFTDKPSNGFTALFIKQQGNFLLFLNSGSSLPVSSGHTSEPRWALLDVRLWNWEIKDPQSEEWRRWPQKTPPNRQKRSGSRSRRWRRRSSRQPW